MLQWQTQLDQIRKDPRAPLVLSAIFGLFLLYAIWQLIDTFITDGPKIPSAHTVIVPEHQLNLADLHLFGIYSASLETLPDTRLQLTLEGTIVILSNPNLSRAVISAPGHPAKVYQVGDKLPGNATVTKIAKHYVVINDNGSLEKLALPIQTISTQ